MATQSGIEPTTELKFIVDHPVPGGIQILRRSRGLRHSGVPHTCGRGTLGKSFALCKNFGKDDGPSSICSQLRAHPEHANKKSREAGTLWDAATHSTAVQIAWPSKVHQDLDNTIQTMNFIADNIHVAARIWIDLLQLALQQL